MSSETARPSGFGTLEHHPDRDSDTQPQGSPSPQSSVDNAKGQENVDGSRCETPTGSVHGSDTLPQSQKAGVSSEFGSHYSARNDQPSSPTLEDGYLKTWIDRDGKIHCSPGSMPIRQYRGLTPAHRGQVLERGGRPLTSKTVNNTAITQQSSVLGEHASSIWKTLQRKVRPTVHSQGRRQLDRLPTTQPRGRYSTGNKISARISRFLG